MAEVFTGALPQGIRFINGVPQVVQAPAFNPPMVRPMGGPPAVQVPAGPPALRIPAGVPAVRPPAGVPAIYNPAVAKGVAQGSIRAAGMAAIPAMGTELVGRASLTAGNEQQRRTLAGYPLGSPYEPTPAQNPMSREGMARRNEVMGISQSATDAWRNKPDMLSSHGPDAKTYTKDQVKAKPPVEGPKETSTIAPKAPSKPVAMPQEIPQLVMPQAPNTTPMGLAEAIPNMPNSMGEVIAGQQVAGAQMQRGDLANQNKLDSWKTAVTALPAFANANVNQGELALKQQMAPSQIAHNLAQAKHAENVGKGNPLNELLAAKGAAAFASLPEKEQHARALSALPRHASPEEQADLAVIKQIEGIKAKMFEDPSFWALKPEEQQARLGALHQFYGRK